MACGKCVHATVDDEIRVIVEIIADVFPYPLSALSWYYSTDMMLWDFSLHI